MMSPTVHAGEIAISQVPLDLRTLQAGFGPSAASATFEVPAKAAALRVVLSIAINGRILSRRTVTTTGRTTVTAPIPSRLLVIQNTIEAAAALPNCVGPACAASLGAVKLTAPIQFRLVRATTDRTDFTQIPMHLKAGINIEIQRPGDAGFAALTKQALAPAAPINAKAAARIVVGKSPPVGFTPSLQFDFGPVELARWGGGTIISSAVLRDATTVQILRGGGSPVVWVRPGNAPPSRLDFGRGNVAVFNGNERIFSFSTISDEETVRILYKDGFDPYGLAWWTTARRWALFVVWILASVLLARVVQRLPKQFRSEDIA